jgi:2,3-bisphosphoglycerate-independent phosphoglycerate mutase
MGNSEVGHLNIGAGFIVNQAITEIDLAIEDGSFFSNPVLLEAVNRAKHRRRRLHLLGLVSDGGVHAHIGHLQALIQLCQMQQLADVAIHAILDGRDTSPTGGAVYLEQVLETCRRHQVGTVASVIGRYYAMDRDNRWERTRVAYDLLVRAEGEVVVDPVGAVRDHYLHSVTDEFMPPLSIRIEGRSPITVETGDSLIFFNFRSDRPRQLTQALTGPDPHGEAFPDRPADLAIATLLPYADYLPLPAAFQPTTIDYPLARVLADHQLGQFHTAETEKYAHVTFFLNGGRETPFDGETRVLVPSPKVATYDLQPEMSAEGVADAACAAIESGDYALVVLNFANCDMVGHTGVLAAAVRATEVVDRQLGRVIDATLSAGGLALVIADHGNAERMFEPGTTLPMTAHTTNPVPCILISPELSPLRQATLRHEGRLADVAPTLLALLGLPQPPVMTGTSLVLPPLSLQPNAGANQVIQQ